MLRAGGTIATIEGNLKGIKSSQRRALERTYRRRVPRDEVVTLELARHIAEVSRDLGRQVGVFVSRDGEVLSVFVGTATRLDLPDVGRLRGGLGRFRGVRYVHTHLRDEPLTADDFNDLILLRLDAVAAITVDAEGRPGGIDVALLAPTAGDEPYRRWSVPELHRLELDFAAEVRALEAEYARRSRKKSGGRLRERALLISLRGSDAHSSEMRELVRSAGVELVSVLRQRRDRIHPGTVVGRGKLQEIVLEGMRLDADVAVFDIDLRPAQARGFEDATGLKAIDRTQLILDIFAQHATSRDGKLQVELAQLKYSLPRLTEKDTGLSRLTGGIGGRGPGETVLEVGRRRVRDRIRVLERQIAELSKQRDVRRRRRRENQLPVLSIVGYTNAGKSTLLNAMTNSEVAAADQLFMTLDPTSRRLRFPKEGEVVITDTVGFLSELPRDLVTAFRATLEELGDADLLLHVVDVSDERLDEKCAAVERLLEELGVDQAPRLLVLNKADLADPEVVAREKARFGGVVVSALLREGLEDLLAAAETALRHERKERGHGER